MLKSSKYKMKLFNLLFRFFFYMKNQIERRFDIGFTNAASKVFNDSSLVALSHVVYPTTLLVSSRSRVRQGKKTEL